MEFTDADKIRILRENLEKHRKKIVERFETASDKLIANTYLEDLAKDLQDNRLDAFRERIIGLSNLKYKRDLPRFGIMHVEQKWKIATYIFKEILNPLDRLSPPSKRPPRER
jgi:hypothetical protein